MRDEEQLDWPKLVAYLREHEVPGADPPLEVMQFRGGHSNLTYLLRFGDAMNGSCGGRRSDRCRPRRTTWRANTACCRGCGRHLRAAPRAILLCEDTSIIGAPFFVMQRREGFGDHESPSAAARASTADARDLPPMSEGFIDALADLHSVDYEKLGLGGLGRPEGFVQRQITGWMDRWEKAKTARSAADEQARRVVSRAHAAGADSPSLLHNDFYLHNVMFAPDNSGKVVGVFDWEMSTLGDPMIDLGLTISYWREATTRPN